MHFFFHASVGDHELAIIQNVVADELVNELSRDAREAVIALVIRLELAERIIKAVRDFDVLAPDSAHELDVMIAGDA